MRQIVRGPFCTLFSKANTANTSYAVTIRRFELGERRSSSEPIPIVSIAGRPKVGKTTFLVKLIAELKQRGYRIGIIKHSIHAFAIDKEGKDTWKHLQAGADAVAFVSPHHLSMIRQVEQEIDLDRAAAMLGDIDIILTEGYKHAHKPKIEISRRDLGIDLVCRHQEIVAVVSDHPIALNVPRFDLDDARGVASLIEEQFLSGR
ncbi:MAG: molybdopterin-guanine dinucleotide biosynthesis protein B [Anaerolineae bacterium]|nr:molybdopterin-guanine dinucleotide biosynthesis protein B [Anaerolineae bacterium]